MSTNLRTRLRRLEAAAAERNGTGGWIRIIRWPGETSAEAHERHYLAHPEDRAVPNIIERVIVKPALSQDQGHREHVR